MAIHVSKAIRGQWVIASGVNRVGGPFDTKQAAIDAARKKAKSGERITADVKGSFKQEVVRKGR